MRAVAVLAWRRCLAVGFDVLVRQGVRRSALGLHPDMADKEQTPLEHHAGLAGPIALGDGVGIDVLVTDLEPHHDLAVTVIRLGLELLQYLGGLLTRSLDVERHIGQSVVHPLLTMKGADGGGSEGRPFANRHLANAAEVSPNTPMPFQRAISGMRP